jgi:outer membrane lipoprotein-sorting protein
MIPRYEGRSSMFSFLRTASTRRLTVTIAAAVGVLAAAGAVAVAATSSAPKPPAKPLSAALHDAAAAPRVQGVTARVEFTNQLLDSSSIQGGSPLLSGASGRLWASSDGRLRLELQSQRGDVEILSDGKTITAYDPTSNTVYKLALPTDAGARSTGQSSIPSVATIEKTLSQLGADANISGAIPSNVAGREAYTVRVSPKHDGGLLGSVELAWDAKNATPLRVAVYPAGSSSPVLELKATEISYGAIDASALSISPPAHAGVAELTTETAHRAGQDWQSPVTGTSAVQKQVPFTLAAPPSLDGLPLQEVRLVSVNSKNAAIVAYGKGLGGIAVLEQAAASADQKLLGSLATVSIDGATGHELATALGTVLTFQRSGVSYTVIGSVPPAAAEAAARGL